MHRRKDDKIPEEHQKLVKQVAFRLVNSTDNGFGCGMQYQDAVQAGYFGLLKAYNTFNGTGTFKGWASTKIRWAILDEVRQNGWGSRRHPFSPRMSIEQDWATPEHFEEYAKRITEEDQVALAALSEVKLNPDDQRVFDMYYIEGMTLMEIGNVLGVTESRVSQRMTRIKRKVREALSDE